MTINGDSTSDALTVSNSINLAGASLNVANTNNLVVGTIYRVLTGSHSGVFAGSNLSAKWVIDYSQADKVQLKSALPPGSLIMLK